MMAPMTRDVVLSECRRKWPMKIFFGTLERLRILVGPFLPLENVISDPSVHLIIISSVFEYFRHDRA